MESIDDWISAAVYFIVEQHGPVTKSFIVDYLNFTTEERRWKELSLSGKLRVVGIKLGGLVRSKKISPPETFVFQADSKVPYAREQKFYSKAPIFRG